MNSSPFFPPPQFSLNTNSQFAENTQKTIRPKCGFSANNDLSAAQAYVASLSIMLVVIVVLMFK